MITLFLKIERNFPRGGLLSLLPLWDSHLDALALVDNDQQIWIFMQYSGLKNNGLKSRYLKYRLFSFRFHIAWGLQMSLILKTSRINIIPRETTNKIPIFDRTQ